MMILVKIGNDLAPGGIVDTFYLALSNQESCAFCILKNMFIGNGRDTDGPTDRRTDGQTLL